MSVIDTLITDRAYGDLTRLNALKAKGWANMTAEEKAGYMSHKGAYNATDLNRVGEAVTYLADLLYNLQSVIREYAESIGVAWDTIYDVPYRPDDYLIEGKTDWQRADIPTPEEMDDYLWTVKHLRDSLIGFTLPDTMDGIEFEGANDIERCLIALDKAIAECEAVRKTYADNAKRSFIYSGEAFSGEF